MPLGQYAVKIAPQVAWVKCTCDRILRTTQLQVLSHGMIRITALRGEAVDEVLWTVMVQ